MNLPAARLCLCLALAAVVLAVPAAAQTIQERVARFAAQMAEANDLYRRFFELDWMIETASFRIDQAQEGLIGWDDAIAEAEALHREVRPALEGLIRIAKTLTFDRGLPGGYDAVIDDTEDYFRRALPADALASLDLLARDIDAARQRDGPAMDAIDLEWQCFAIRAIEGENVLLRGRMALVPPDSPERFLIDAMLAANDGMIAALDAVTGAGADLQIEADVVRPLREAARAVREAADGIDRTRGPWIAQFRAYVVAGSLAFTEADLAALAENYAASARAERAVASVLDDMAGIFADAGTTDSAGLMAGVEAVMAELERIIANRLRAAEERAAIVARGMQ